MALSDFDEYVIDKLFQPVGDWYTDRSGRPVYELAETLAVVSGLIGAGIWSVDHKNFFADIGVMFILGFSWLEWTTCRRMGQDATRAAHRGMMSRYRRFNPFGWMRIYLLFWVLLEAVIAFLGWYANLLTTHIWWLAFYINWTALQYFQACSPKLPKPKKQTAPSLSDLAPVRT